MKSIPTHFRKMRRFIRIAAVITPALSFAACILYAQELSGFALCSGILAFIVANAFPNKKEIESASFAAPMFRLPFVLQIIPCTLAAMWLVQVSGFTEFIDHALSSSALWDWRLITAVGIWHFYWIIDGYRRALSMPDEKIIEVYADTHQAEPQK